MLLFQLASIVLTIGIRLVVAADAQPEFTPPGVLTSVGDSDTALQPYPGQADDAVNETKFIRGLLTQRQASCSSGYGVCSGGGCCPITGECCGGGCCRLGYYCTVVSGQSGCCQDGQVCNRIGSGGGGCVTSGYVPCAGENFCCQPGYTCSRDGAGNPQCNLYSTYTSTSTIDEPTLTFKSPQPTSISNGGGDLISNDLTSTSSSRPNGLNSVSLSRPNGLNTVSSSRPNGTSSSSSSRPTSSAFTSTSNGVADWKGCSSYFGFAPFLVFIGVYM